VSAHLLSESLDVLKAVSPLLVPATDSNPNGFGMKNMRLDVIALSSWIFFDEGRSIASLLKQRQGLACFTSRKACDSLSDLSACLGDIKSEIDKIEWVC
jgi:hypothetical protein